MSNTIIAMAIIISSAISVVINIVAIIAIITATALRAKPAKIMTC